MNDFRYHGRKAVIIGNFNFVGGNGIVCIDDRNNAHFQKGFQCVFCIFIAAVAAQLLLCQKHLCHRLIIPVEKIMINLHQHCLSHSCRRLLFAHSSRACFHCHTHCADPNRAARNQNNILAAVA